MASISRDANGTKRILFTDGDQERRVVRLGRVSVKIAEKFQVRIEALLAAKALHQPPDVELADWLDKLPDRFYKRLVRVELVEPRACSRVPTLGELFVAFFATVDVKSSTRVRMKQAETALLSHFPESKHISTIREADADAWRAKLKEDGYAAATISRTVLYARQMFRWAIRRGMVRVNPFANLKTGAQVNPARAMFIDRDTIAKVIDAAPSAEWRLLITLSRFGGLRVPSEVLALKWTDIDWEHSRLTIHSPKTEHHDGKGERIIPLFPEIREHLQAVFDAAPIGAVNVIVGYEEGANLNTQLRRIIRRAGVTPWPRTWHNLRASRQTELAATFPLHTVCAWIGNTKAIAAGHYLQVTDADWTRAVGEQKSGAKSGAPTTQNAAQHPTASDCTDSPDSSKEPAFTGVSQADASECDPLQIHPMGRPGLEPSQLPAGNTRGEPKSGAKSGALSDDPAASPALRLVGETASHPIASSGPDGDKPAPKGADLREDVLYLLRMWPALPVAIQDAIIAIVNAWKAGTPAAGPVLPPESALPLDAHIEAFAADLERWRRTQEYRYTTERRLRQAARTMQWSWLTDCTTESIRAYLAQIGRTRTIKLVNEHLAGLNAFFAWAVQSRRMAANPCEALTTGTESAGDAPPPDRAPDGAA